MTHEVDKLMGGKKYAASFSCPSNLLMEVEKFRVENRMNPSEAMTRLIRLGLTYLLVLEEQRVTKAKEKAKPTKKKKVKSKDPR